MSNCIRKILIFLLSCLFFQCASLNREIKTIYDYDYAAKFYYDREDYSKSIDYYKKLIQKFSSESSKYEKELAWAQYEIGFCYLRMKRYAVALTEFKKVLYEYDFAAAKILSRQRINEIENTLYKE